MELFMPSFLIVILASVIVFTVLPRFGPLILTLISIGLLSFGVYHHWSLFKREYTDATWYDSMTVKFLAPALLLGITFLFILGYILSFFGSGVPVPAVPEVTETVNTVTENINNMANGAVENITNTVRNLAAQATNTVAGLANKATNAVGLNGAPKPNNGGQKPNNGGQKPNNRGILNGLRRNNMFAGSPATNLP
jgi:hypothetical protein